MIKYIQYFLILILSSVTFNLFTETIRLNRRHEFDDREVKNDLTPKYLNAIGSLGYIDKNKRIKSRKNIECGGNLIALEKNIDSNLIITAEHCISHSINTYSWTSYNNKNEKVFRKGKLVLTDKKNDIAIIKLTKSISFKEIEPLILAKDINIENENFTVAGYSVDSLGNYGKNLTYDIKPDYVKIFKNRGIGEVGSITYQGDSGGAIIYNSIKDNTHYLIGIMSFIEKNKNIFKNEVGILGNLSGYFVDLINNESLSDDLLYFIKKNFL